jgi:hypothetical protein
VVRGRRDTTAAGPNGDVVARPSATRVATETLRPKTAERHYGGKAIRHRVERNRLEQGRDGIICEARRAKLRVERLRCLGRAL